MLQDKTKWI